MAQQGRPRGTRNNCHKWGTYGHGNNEDILSAVHLGFFHYS